ncbi:hypothetical protein DSC45_30540 [Streptomyces sp. YIM 130001]|uniref:DUF6082 family protein n=1 Tax=Streptomyces sp. YIM 130001 TaxID=2259644 RepID=UPI000E648EBA|nr:DUF6082 family protein [Streptomyces sp. YIM 130001]RII09419.1 hypothetical protein DSC45_30540 [Streptomyces sp. YIM 130001]
MATQIRLRGSCATAAGLTLAVAGMLAQFRSQHRKYDELRLRIDRLTAAEEHHRHTALIHQQRLQLTLLCKAVDDPELADVLDTYDEPLDPGVRRQYLFANAVYTNALLALRVGIVNREELYGHLRMICRSPVFQQYWHATRHHRASLKDGSDEVELGLLVDGLIRDLEDADTDEWWVVGEPPGTPDGAAPTRAGDAGEDPAT